MKEILLSSNHGGALYESNDGRCGIAYHLKLFNSFVVYYSNRWYKSFKDNHIELLGDTTRTDGHRLFKNELKTLKDVTDFCTENKIELVEVITRDHPLAHGLPDCRSIH